ncbi:DUF1918 domain-containing protein [Streptosporangium carneum]|uniref:DUF1918 domain-containing protein n=1 Tax=Streptosporangium carneum TaxID=47481 RepID=A0A9W6I1D6_9ACTN|nr:DUF1918 domain-containing protein [Streptosporangium carneum]GLK10232.1 hypothetical protein GCM10017600_36380 [Streptosporangium carneum]
MKAAVGDKLVVEGTRHGETRRIGVIVELVHEDGSPPYMVHWEHDEHETMVFPGPDAHVVAGDQTNTPLTTS